MYVTGAADRHEPGSPPAEAEDPPFRQPLGSAMIKTIACFGLAAAIAASPTLALAQTGTSSSWGSYGSGPTIPTQSLTPFDRSWNHSHEAENEAIAGADWVREHAGANTLLGPVDLDRSPRTNPRRYRHQRRGAHP